jgi:hypothetical protein
VEGVSFCELVSTLRDLTVPLILSDGGEDDGGDEVLTTKGI